ncbi:MAG: methyltransferase domain-containing protein [Lachnospiraceae bacterium]|nr:methyltransferase domain-containing protein [Lachnospiraceae bacterium]
MIPADASQRISERLWNQPDKGELESHREETFIDDIIQKSHIERELLAALEGVETVFDGGAGCGRFSILLAKKGCRVTHFDISQPMLDKAQKLARAAGVEQNITFVRGALEDLSAYPDRAFDLVISFDTPISYTYPHQETVIGELVRIARKKVMFSVSSRLGYLPYLANPIQKNQFILSPDCPDPWVRQLIADRQKAIDSFVLNKETIEDFMKSGVIGGSSEISEYERGGTPWCITYTFLPDELKALLEKQGVQNIHMAGPGAYARTIPGEILVKIMNDSQSRKDFLEICHRYDSNIYVCGMGKDNLFVKGDIV